MSGRCSFPEDHPLFAGFLPAMRERIVQLLSGHDVVFAVGAAAFTYHVEGEGPHIPEGTALYQLIEDRSEEHTSELQSRPHLVCRLLLVKKKTAAPLSN